ncbi:hypothetical protein SAMN04488123_108123 [Natribacillus halophilus]|uniref:3-hydroxyisobutyrate dehydrogenase n=1 Tax=Natribacillus halophilus TaxID=549003 RepID=A0A1G8PFX7_9BACI|nr:hypothetical protein SAMN04488123_108123 [Natribacillus halophilus]
MPVADVANEHFEYGKQNGLSDLDWSAMIKAVNDQTRL